MGSSRFKGLSHFDAYAKTLDDFRIKTSTGGTVLSLDSIQATGDYQINLASNIYKKRLDRDGNEVVQERTTTGDKSKKVKDLITRMKKEGYCGSCFGAGGEGECCNSCNEVKRAYSKRGWDITSAETIEQCVAEGWTNLASEQKGEGCNMYGHLLVKKIPGVFHIALGESINFLGMHMHSAHTGINYDYSHTINKLAFGVDSELFGNSLGGVKKSHPPGSVKFQYFLKVVATELHGTDGTTTNTYQYSVTQHEENLEEEESTLPGIFFKFEISPMLITMSQTRKSFASFLTSLCAIVGGIITVASLVDALIYHTERTLLKKMELGKTS